MTIEYLDPRSEPGLPADPYDLKIDVTRPGLTIGLLANGFPDSVIFLNEVGVALKKRLPGIRLQTFDKGNPTAVADDSMLDAMTAGCQAVVAAYGH
ncbi:MAG: hypothetical protein PHY29_00850 [Syntrophales bacterium]|nr:hypothetical protein [Syntrophales bacterium]